jgi:hypothetical protein
MNLSRSDITKPGFNDIGRTRDMVKNIGNLVEDEPFAFGLTSSRSFSDLHYRYFFLIQGLRPEPVLSGSYQTLTLVCEGQSCPTESEMTRKKFVQLLCYDPHCEGEYPTIDFALWKFDAVTDMQGAKLYVLKR